MNELLTLVHEFNQNHEADAFFDYSGHVELVDVYVNEAGTVYAPNQKQNRLFIGKCYLDTDAGQYPTIEALTEAFKAFVEGYEE